MPELPEVETIRRDLSRLIVGKKILAIESDLPKQVKPSLAAVRENAVGAMIKKVERRAKIIQILLGKDRVLLVHLKMTGRLLVRDKNEKKDDWQHITISLSGNKELRFCDLRKFGWIKIVKISELRIANSELGIEPFDKAFTFDYLKKIFAKTSRPIKIVLMDQQKIAGVGNIYANEALFLAKIDPRRPANKLKEMEIKKIKESLLKVLRAGIRYRGASDQHYLDALGRKGQYQEHFLVYGRVDKRCPNNDNVIKGIKLGGRGTFFCPSCQK